jgi:hypothetical protein
MSSSASTLFSHKLSDFAPWNQDNDANIDDDVVLFVDDSLLTSYHHSGAFAMDSLLLKYCRSSNYKIILLLTGQSSSHYQSILMKNVLDILFVLPLLFLFLVNVNFFFLLFSC